MARALAVVLLFVLTVSGCARRAPSPDARQGGLTLCVSNESSSVGTIRVYVENFRALTVQSGRRACRPIRGIGAGAQLRAESVGGGLRGPVRYQGEIRSTDIRCWEWVLRDSPTSEIRLIPCDQSQ